MKNSVIDILVEPEDKTNYSLLAFLEAEGLSQAAFGKNIGVQRATVNGWVRQGKKPSVAMLVRIATFFGKSPEAMNTTLGFDVDLREYKHISTPLRIQVKGLEKKVADLTRLVAQLIAV